MTSINKAIRNRLELIYPSGHDINYLLGRWRRDNRSLDFARLLGDRSYWDALPTSGYGIDTFGNSPLGG